MFVRGPNPIWTEFNTTGQIFDDTYYAFFLTNTLPYLPQAVYQDPNGLIPWSDPIEFQPSGGLPNNLYFNPNLVYRIEFRQGPDQTYPLIGNPIENYIPGTGTSINADPLITAQNSITNPQFSDLYIPSPYTFTEASSGTYTIYIGPGWKLVLTGAGTTVLTQIANPGNSDIFGNPPYALQIANTGWTTAQLIQTFANNGAIFGGGAIAVYFEAETTSSTQIVTVSYQPNVGSGTTIFTGVIATGSLEPYENAVNIPDSTNTDTGNEAYVDIVFNISGTQTITFTNIQLTGQSTNLSSSFNPLVNIPVFQEQTYEQTVNNEYHSLRMLPLDSILVGWNFALNPWQFWPTPGANVATNEYTADQTIIIQQNYVANATGNNINVSQSSYAQNDGIVINAVAAHNTFAMLQYVDPSTMQPYFGSFLSALVTAQIVTTHSTSVQFKMRLIYKSTAPGATSQTVPVASWTEGSDPVFSAGFTAIAPINDPIYTLGQSGIIQKFAFNGFQLPVSPTSTTFVGIVLYTISNMNSASTADYIVINDVSLVPNIFATASNPKTWDDTLSECRYYWEQSYPFGGTAAQILPSAVGQQYSPAFTQTDGTNSYMYQTEFSLNYKRIKRVTPTTTFYALDGTSANVTMGMYYYGGHPSPTSGANPTKFAITDWTVVNASTSGVVLIPTTAGGASGIFMTVDANTICQGEINYHYSANSRIG